MSAVTNPEIYDVIVLAGVTSPGKVTLSGHDKVVKWDVKEGQGLNGASTTLKSQPPVEFTCSFYLADEADKAAWPAFRALIESTLTTKKTNPPKTDAAVQAARKDLANLELDIRRNRPTTPAEIKTKQNELEHKRLTLDAAVKVSNAVAAVKRMNALDIYNPDLAEQGITSVVMATIAGVVHDGKGGETRVVKFQAYKAPKPATGSLSGSSASKAADPNQAALDELAALTAKYQATPWG
jgi:hypothetical protein